MAASALRDLLSTTDALFNRSDDLHGEVTRLVRTIQGRRAPAEVAEIVRLAAAGVDASSLQLLAATASSSGSSTGSSLTVLEQALEDCRAATAAITSLHENRNAVVDARAERIQSEQEQATASREQLLAELRAGSAATEESYLAELREIVAATQSSSSAPTPAAATAAAAATAGAAAAAETPPAAAGDAAAPATEAGAEAGEGSPPQPA